MCTTTFFVYRTKTIIDSFYVKVITILFEYVFRSISHL